MSLVEVDIPYSPSAILNLFNNAIAVAQSKKLILLKGIFTPGKGFNYNGYYYDQLKDEGSDAQLTLIVPALIRGRLTENKTITFYGYITKKVVNNGGRIEVQITITELVEQSHNKYTDEEVKAIEIQQQKAAIGYRDVYSFIKSRVASGKPIRIIFIVGRAGIIDSDIKHQLKESIGYYTIEFHKTNLSSEADIISSIQQFNTDSADILVVARGGGENLEVFNKLAIASACLELKPYFITAIGHKEDVTLLQKVADKAFITPSAAGQFFNDVYNQSKEEIEISKAKLVDTITKQLAANYEKQILNLKESIKSLEELKAKSSVDMQKVHEQNIAGLNTQITLLTKNQSEKLSVLERQISNLNQESASKNELLQSYKKQVASLESKSSTNWVAIIVAAIIGLVLGLLFSKA